MVPQNERRKCRDLSGVARRGSGGILPFRAGYEERSDKSRLTPHQAAGYSTIANWRNTKCQA
jgi:hypothetical protein